MAQQQQSVTGIILAGGMARRMGGMDKGLIQLAGHPMIEYVINGLSPQIEHLLINANRSQDHYAQYGYPVFGDAVEEFAGPLAGIAAALEHSPTELILTVPCDGPWLPADLKSRLLQRLEEEQADACVCHDGDRRQPVFGIFHKRLRPAIVNYLESGERKLQKWLDGQNVAMEDFSDYPEAFTNVNTPEERDRVEALLELQSAAE